MKVCSYTPSLISTIKNGRSESPVIELQPHLRRMFKKGGGGVETGGFYILYNTFFLLPNYMGRWSNCYTDVHLNKQDQVQTLHCYKYRGKVARQNIITQVFC